MKIQNESFRWERLLDYCIVSLFSLLFCVYTVITCHSNIQLSTGVSPANETFLHSPAVLCGVFFLFCVLWLLGWMFLNPHNHLERGLHKHKVLFTIIFVALWLLFNLNCTSLYCWTSYLDGAGNYTPLWGIPRSIRSDEWAIWSPFVFSQQHEGYPAINSMISGGGIDSKWISIGGIPAWNTALLFKPLYWGFLLFGLEFGFSFLSVLRFVLLFWTSYKFAWLYTKNRIFSFAAAISLTFAPYVQWYFSQSIAEVFIYAQGMLISGYCYLNANGRKQKIVSSISFAYLLGCYIMIAYPSWLISVFYLVLVLGIWGVWRHRKNLSFRKDIFAVVPTLITLGIILYGAFLSKGTLLAVSNSIYPGDRLFTGNGITRDFKTGLFSILFPLKYSSRSSNVCNASNFLSFTPAGLLLAIYSLIEEKEKRDKITLVLIATEVFFAIFLFVGFSPALAKITLLSQCTRLHPVVSLIDLMLLYRCLAKRQTKLPLLAIILLTAASALFYWLPGISRYLYPKLIIWGIFLLGGLVFFLIYSYDPQNKKSARRLCYVIICCTLLAGGFVNPVQRGISCVTELDLVQELDSLPDDAMYIVEGEFPITNAPLLAGKRCYNSTTVYPNLEKWTVLDPSGAYEDVYNRFCHVATELCHESTSFELIQTDYIKLNLSFYDLRKLNIEYLITANDYSDNRFDGMRMELVTSTEQYNVYQLIYD